MSVPDREVVAVRTAGPHDHIERVKFADGTDADAATAIQEIVDHVAHYVMHLEGQELPLLLQVRQCPDCLTNVLWA